MTVTANYHKGATVSTPEPFRSEPPTFKDMMVPALRAIWSAGGSASNEEIAARVIEDMSLPAEIVDMPHGDGRSTKVEYRLGWTRTYLKKAGLIVNSARSVWSLTRTGRNHADSNYERVDPQEIVKTYQSKLRQKKTIGGAEGVDNVNNAEDINDNVNNIEEINGEDALRDTEDTEGALGGEVLWQDELLEKLLSIPPSAFERLCQRLLREQGFIEVEVTGKSGDGGIDGHGVIRLANLISFPVVFQCKRFTGSVSASTLRDFRGAMTGRADKGLVITTGTFTQAAKKEALRDGAPPIDLINGETLVDLLKQAELGVKVTPRTVEDIEINTDFFDAL